MKLISCTYVLLTFFLLHPTCHVLCLGPLSGTALLVFAQGPDTLWTRTYGGALDEFGMSLQQTADSGYVMTGWTESFGAGDVDVYLIKTNANGDTLWTRTYGGTMEDGGNSVQQASDGGYIIAGHTYSFGAGMFDVYLIRTDSIGDTLWTKTYGGYLYDQGWSVQETSDGGYIIGGFTGLFDPLYDFWLLKTDKNGDTLWTKIYGGSLTEWCNSVRETSDGGYILAGFTGYFNDYNVYLVKTDSNGGVVWTKTYGGMHDDYAWAAEQTSDGGYIVIGWTFSYGAGDADIWLIKTNADGDSIWSKTYGGQEEDKAKWVQEIPGVGYIITGSTFSTGMGGADIYLIKTDLNGDVIWANAYGGADWDRGSVGEFTSDGGYVIAGFTKSFGGGNADVWLLKTRPDTVGIEEHKHLRPLATILQMSPNPFSKKTDIRYGKTDNSRIDLKIYDATGRVVQEFNQLTSHQSSINQIIWDGTDHAHRPVPSGVYFLKLIISPIRTTGSGREACEYSETRKLMLIR
ncbi:MAG: T9SS type A sorting domain-containing protein [candidate division WOR-3 bacterium]|nr:MAG: T9SS type A sorting domain-containing protein [candidate division WOR-3 bacterium]